MCKIPVIFLVFFLERSNSVKLLDSRILGGTEVQDRSQFAYQAQIQLYNFLVCGGSIIAPAFVLTAAQCVTDDSGIVVSHLLINVIVGNLKVNDTSNKHAVTDIILHENYNRTIFTADIALLKLLDVFIEWTKFVKPINLTTGSTTKGTCIISGWGATYINGSLNFNLNLLFAEVPIVTWSVCKNEYTDYLDYKMICAGTTTQNACQGDSGGPLVCKGKLTGIVSFGSKCTSSPTVYVEVARYIAWINEKVGYVIAKPEIDQNPTTDSTPDEESTTYLSTSLDNDSQGDNSAVQISFLSVTAFTFCFILNFLNSFNNCAV